MAGANLKSRGLPLLFYTVFFAVLRTDVQAYINVRLEGGVGLHEGRVEVMTDGFHWNTLCGTDNFDINDVIVLCRQLGYRGANRAISTARYGTVLNPMYNLAFLCTGNENDLNFCAIASTYCPSGVAAGAVCYSEESGYMGCYNDRVSDTILTGPYVYAQYLTIDRCMDFCRVNNYSYAGIKLGHTCFCGPTTDSYDRFGQTTDSGCQLPCGGDQYSSCGGRQAMAIFEVARQPVTTSTPALTLAPVATERSMTTLLPGVGSSLSAGTTSMVTVRMVAKEAENFISQPSGIAVVIILSLVMLVLIVTVVFLLRRRSSDNVQQRKTSTRPYEEINLDQMSVDSVPGHLEQHEDTNEPDITNPTQPLVMTPPNHTYEQAELFSANERTSNLYYSVPDELPANDRSSTMYSSVPDELSANGSERPTTPQEIRDLYAKPNKERKTDPPKVNSANYETIDENLTFKTNADSLAKTNGFSPANGVAVRIEESDRVGYSNVELGGTDETELNLDEMYAKPMKKHKAVLKQNSFDESCMVENELYTPTKS